MKNGWGQATGWDRCLELPSLLWPCWLGDRKDIRPRKRPMPVISTGFLRQPVEEVTNGQQANPGSPGKLDCYDADVDGSDSLGVCMFVECRTRLVHCGLASVRCWRVSSSRLTSQISPQLHGSLTVLAVSKRHVFCLSVCLSVCLHQWSYIH